LLEQIGAAGSDSGTAVSRPDQASRARHRPARQWRHCLTTPSRRPTARPTSSGATTPARGRRGARVRLAGGAQARPRERHRLGRRAWQRTRRSRDQARRGWLGATLRGSRRPAGHCSTRPERTSASQPQASTGAGGGTSERAQRALSRPSTRRWRPPREALVDAPTIARRLSESSAKCAFLSDDRRGR